MAYIGVSPSNGVRRVHTYTATGSQTTFSGAGAEGTSLSYKDSNFVDVYQNGVKLGDADYTATSGTSIVLGTGASASDLVVIVVFDVFSVADTVSKADGGTFDGAVTFAGDITDSGDLTVDVAGDLTLDVGGADIIFKDDGTQIGRIRNVSSGELTFQADVQDKDIVFNGNDGGSTVTALTLDMSDAGKATFNSGIVVDNKVESASGESLTLESPSGGAVIFNSNGANERMRITSAGFIDIGTIGHSSTSMLDIASPNLSGTAATISLQNNTDNTGGYFVAFYRSNNSLIGNISQGSGSVAYNETSDYRLKENVVTDWDATTRLKQLKPSRFNFKDYKDTTIDGFLAHEVSSIVPEAVTGEKDAVDEDGNPIYQGIDKGKLVPLLVKSLQEALTRIDTLETEVKTLKGE